MTIPENATYTAAEVKVLTEAALRLGRKEAGEQIADALKRRRDEVREEQQRGWPLLTEAAVIAREIASQPSPDATSGRTDPSMGADLPQDSQAGREGVSDRKVVEAAARSLEEPECDCRYGHQPQYTKHRLPDPASTESTTRCATGHT